MLSKYYIFLSLGRSTDCLRKRGMCAAVLPDGRGYRQIIQKRPYKKIICSEKLVEMKVAVLAIRCCDTNLVKFWKFVKCLIQKWRAEKNDKIPPQTLCFFCHCCCALKYHAAANFFIGGRESFEKGRGFWRMWPCMLVRTWQHWCAVFCRATGFPVFRSLPRDEWWVNCGSHQCNAPQPNCSCAENHQSNLHGEAVRPTGCLVRALPNGLPASSLIPALPVRGPAMLPTGRFFGRISQKVPNKKWSGRTRILADFEQKGREWAELNQSFFPSSNPL